MVSGLSVSILQAGGSSVHLLHSPLLLLPAPHLGWSASASEGRRHISNLQETGDYHCHGSLQNSDN